jgi:hypothetical protein
MTRRAAFSQADVARAVKACAQAGMQVGTVRILPGGAIEVYSAEAAAAVQRVNSIDELVGNAP